MTLGSAAGTASADTVLTLAIGVGADPWGVAITADGARAYVTTWTVPGTVTVIALDRVPTLTETPPNGVLGTPTTTPSPSPVTPTP